MSNPKKPKSKGMHTYRFRDNPEEKRFADAWLKENAVNATKPTPLLTHLLNMGGHDAAIVEPSERDQVTAATVIHWLGTPNGQCFLRDLGYVKSADFKEEPVAPKPEDSEP